MKDQTSIIHGLKMGDETTIRNLYDDYKNGFLFFAKKFQLDGDELLDVYQDAIVALCEHAKKGQLDQLNNELKTYFFAIGKYMIYGVLKQKKKTVSFEEEGLQIDWKDEVTEENSEKIELLKTLFLKLGEQCKKILRLFYYEEKKMDEIVKLMNYDNKDVAKSQKSRCIKKLKSFVKST